MAVIIYQQDYERGEVLENFLDLFYGSQMKYLASDLLREGFTPRDIETAVQRAMVAGKTVDLYMRRHFLLVYTQMENDVIRDCKLSRLGYAMVLLNANPELPIVGEWQMKVLKNLFKTKEKN